MRLDTLRDLYIEQLKDLHSAERQLLDALPNMAKGAFSLDLKQAFQEHLRQTEQQVLRLEQILHGMGEKAKGQTCEGMKGLIREGDEMLDMKGRDKVIDAGLIACAQRIEHYEIAGYGTVRAYAQTLGETQHLSLLEQSLKEEEETDKRLSKLAESHINEEALVGR